MYWELNVMIIHFFLANIDAYSYVNHSELEANLTADIIVSETVLEQSEKYEYKTTHMNAFGGLITLLGKSVDISMATGWSHGLLGTLIGSSDIHLVYLP